MISISLPHEKVQQASRIEVVYYDHRGVESGRDVIKDRGAHVVRDLRDEGQTPRGRHALPGVWER